MKNSCYKKTFVFGIIVLFISMSVIPSNGNMIFFDDTTPPVTTYELDPPMPDGNSDWYVSDVNVTLNATDDISGVKEIKYQVDGGAVQTLPGSTGTFTVTTDSTMHSIKYWSIDNVGNAESQKTIQFKQDQTVPEIDFTYEWSGDKPPYTFIFNATAIDATSNMARVEFYNNWELQETVYGPGPYYIWAWLYPTPLNKFNVRGLIRNLEITDDYVRFYAILVQISRLFQHNASNYICAIAYNNAGNNYYDCIEEPCLSVTIEPGFYLFKNLILPNNYTGYIGRYFIWATFSNP
jgi:hypothetical protein